MMDRGSAYTLKQPVFLIGFMGAGKSSVARRLARSCGVTSLDLDTYIERREGRKISTIFKEEGEEAFRKLERETLAEIARGSEPLLVSCGGGIIVSEENRQTLKDEGITVHLVVDADEAAGRIRDKSSRPLFNDLEAARKRLEERMPFYEEAADFSIETRGKNVPAIARELKAVLERNGILCQQPE